MENGMNYLWFHHQNNMQGGDGRYGRVTATSTMFDDYADPELDHKARRVGEKLSENFNIIANDSSLAFFRIQEHVRKTLPQLVEQKHEVQDIQQKVQGACFDTEYATNAVKTMHGSSTHFKNIQDLLKNAMFMKQQIEYEDNRRKLTGQLPGMYSPSKTTESGVSPSATSNMVDSSDSSLSHSGNAQMPDDEIGIPATEENVTIQTGARYTYDLPTDFTDDSTSVNTNIDIPVNSASTVTRPNNEVDSSVQDSTTIVHQSSNIVNTSTSYDDTNLIDDVPTTSS